MDAVLRELAATGAVVRADEPLGPLTTLRVGGPARALVLVPDEPVLASVLRVALDVGWPWLVIGRGSNLLVPDSGWPGVVVRLGGRFRDVTVTGRTVRAGGAVPLPTVSVRAAEAGLGGFAWGVAVPGTVGGAVRTNAGAHGADMADALVVARILRAGEAVAEPWGVDRLGLRYRGSDVPADAVVTGVELQLERADAAVVRDEMDEIRAWRRAHQPLHAATCGSVFANPVGVSAGALIDAAGLRGRRIGGAVVSTTHANFIETSPGATAGDVLALIELVRTEVRRTSGHDLRTEVVVLPAGGA